MGGTRYWVWPVRKENWETVKKDRVWASRTEHATYIIKDGDEIIFYLKGAGIFCGIFKVKGEWYVNDQLRWPDGRREGKKKYRYEIRLQDVITGAVDVKEIKDRLDFLRRVPKWQLGLRASPIGPANGGKPISEKDYKTILREFMRGISTPARREEVRPSHNTIVEWLIEIGELLNFRVKKEEYTPDGAYRCDITWREYESHRPIKVFEVELSHNIEHALSSLAHAYDVWGAEQLFLIVEDEKDTERAKKLIIPRVRGAFAKIADRLRIYSWTDIRDVYEALREKEKLIRELAKRSS